MAELSPRWYRVKSWSLSAPDPGRHAGGEGGSVVTHCEYRAALFALEARYADAVLYVLSDRSRACVALLLVRGGTIDARVGHVTCLHGMSASRICEGCAWLSVDASQLSV